MKKSSPPFSHARCFSNCLAAFVFLAVPSMASAHPQVGGADGFARGMIHPLTGLDHLCAILAVGLWAAQTGGRAVWIMPGVFISMMTVGGILGITGVTLPLVEPGIATSVLVLGMLVATAKRLSISAGSVLIAVFALLHGHAHGSEMPATTSGLEYALGFLCATALLYSVGLAIGLTAKKTDAWQFIRLAGGAIALFGVYLTCVL
jgi:urease accessory protein